jgi:hypothetical protein
VLIDDFQLLGTMGPELLEIVVSEYALDVREPPLRLALSYTSWPRDGYSVVVDQINKWIEQYAQSPFLEHVQLARFSSSDTVAFARGDLDQLALIYKLYLLHLEPPVVIKPAVAGNALTWFLKALHDKVNGVPSKLELRTRDNADVEAFVEAARDIPEANVLIIADDDALLAQDRGGGG